MADENVIFEIQVEKKILEQIFNENKYLRDRYNQLLNTSTAREEIATLRNETEDVLKLNKKLIDENDRLKATLKDLERNRRIDEEGTRIVDLDHTENKLLKMKLQKAETEKNRIVKQFENETKILEGRLRDKSNLQTIADRLDETSRNFENVCDELKKTKKRLAQAEAENRQLDKDKLNLELQAKEMSRKLRLEEEGNKSNDLAQVECKLLKLKLHSVETEKKYLQQDFERERKIITKQNKPRVVKLEENIKHLRKWIEREARERNRDSGEVKSLKAQIQALENDKVDLIEGFELERKVFRKILKANGNYNLP